MWSYLKSLVRLLSVKGLLRRTLNVRGVFSVVLLESKVGMRSSMAATLDVGGAVAVLKITGSGCAIFEVSHYLNNL